jgi:hypothetical protein
MPPRGVEYVSRNDETDLKSEEIAPPEAKRPPMQIVWRNVTWMFYIHVAALYGLYLFFYSQYKTWAFSKSTTL